MDIMRWCSLWSSCHLLLLQPACQFSSLGFCILIFSSMVLVVYNISMLLVFAFLDNVDHHCWGVCFCFLLSLTMLIVIFGMWCLLHHHWCPRNFNVLTFHFFTLYIYIYIYIYSFFSIFLFFFSLICLWFHVCRCSSIFSCCRIFWIQVLLFLQIITIVFHFFIPCNCFFIPKFNCFFY